MVYRAGHRDIAMEQPRTVECPQTMLTAVVGRAWLHAWDASTVLAGILAHRLTEEPNSRDPTQVKPEIPTYYKA